MRTYLPAMFGLGLAIWSVASVGHDLIGIDAERERKVKTLESLTASTPASSPSPTAARPAAAPLVPAPSGGAAPPNAIKKLSPQSVRELTAMANRDQALVIAKAMARGPAVAHLGVIPTIVPTRLDSVINNAKTWNPGTTLKVCFYDGNDLARKFVKAYATRWTAYGNVVFDFGTSSMRNCSAGDGSVIRVTFAVGGYASYVGDDAAYYAKQNQPTLFLQQLDQVDLAQDKYKSIVIHEFGHALGFEHEHQSPMSTCEAQFDLAAIEAALGWDDQKVHANFDEIHISKLYQEGDLTIGTTAAGTRVTVSPYDRLSVMHYALPESYFVQPTGDCYIPLNADLSERDQKAMAVTYPYVDAHTHIAAHNSQIDAILRTPNLPAMSKESLKALRK